MFLEASQPKNPAYMLKIITRNTAENASGSKELRKLNRIIRVTPFEFPRISFSFFHDKLVESAAAAGAAAAAAAASFLSRAILFNVIKRFTVSTNMRQLDRAREIARDVPAVPRTPMRRV